LGLTAAGLAALALVCGCGGDHSVEEEGMVGQHQKEAGPQRFDWSGAEGYIPLLEGRPMTCGMRSGRVALGPGETCGEHTTGGHEEFIIVLEGRGQGLSEGREPVALEAGQSLYVPPHTVHNMKNVDAPMFKYIYVVAPIAGEAAEEAQGEHEAHAH
jgi:quercetin dioxygenase-like cupin family protein